MYFCLLSSHSNTPCVFLQIGMYSFAKDLVHVQHQQCFNIARLASFQLGEYGNGVLKEEGEECKNNRTGNKFSSIPGTQNHPGPAQMLSPWAGVVSWFSLLWPGARLGPARVKFNIWPSAGGHLVRYCVSAAKPGQLSSSSHCPGEGKYQESICQVVDQRPSRLQSHRPWSQHPWYYTVILMTLLLGDYISAIIPIISKQGGQPPAQKYPLP